MTVTKKTGFVRIYHASINSYKGFVFLMRHEAAFRQEFILFLVLLPVVFLLELDRIEKLLLIASLLLVLIVEILNTAIETTVDRISLEHHQLSGLAKDLGSFAVLLSIGLVMLTWWLILV